MNPQAMTAATAALGLFVSMLWGGNVIALKYGLDTFPPLWSAFWRFLSGAVAVIVWAKLQGVRLWPDRRDWRAVVLLGVLFTLQITCLNFGVGWTSAAFAVVLLNSHPVFTNLQGHFADSEEKLNGRRLFGLALAFGGICWVAAGKPSVAKAPLPIWGNVLMIVSANLLALRVIYTRRLVQSTHPTRPVVWQMVFSLPFFLGGAWVLEPPTLQPVRWEPVAAILYQGVVIAGFCFVAWTTLLRSFSASTLSMFAFTVPFFGVLLSAVVLDEAIPPSLLLGALLVTAGIVIVTRSAQAPARKPPKESPAPGAVRG
ncbi:MAG: EamA family transporter [Acidobacteria bacterium]|nr:EamA family transporter [Acidobacteriota bacterium]